MRRSKINVVSSFLALASSAIAQVATVSPTSDVSFKLNIPADTASSGDGDIFFQISAPSTYEWVALGQGSAMAGSNIFVVYTSGDGTNVTVSPRLATGHNMPDYNSDAEVTLLEGSGVTNGQMIANVKCSNCNSWSGGTADFTASTGKWIYAYHSTGGPKDSDDQSESITEHDEKAAFSWSYASAKGGDSVNPLVSAASSGTATSSCVPRSTTVSGAVATSTSATLTLTDDDDDVRTTSRRGRPTDYSDFRSRFAETTGTSDNEKRQEINYCDESSSSTDTGFTLISSSSQSNTKKKLAAHAIMASLAFVIFFPAGAIAIRLASFSYVVAFHAAFQVFAYIVYIAAFALGVIMANDFDVLNSRHPIIGIVVFVGLFFQPFLGFIHHSLFMRYQTRTFVSHIHIWLGRIIMVLGIVNGGLGFKLAEQLGRESKSGKIAYVVLAAIFGVAWIAAIVIGERKKAKSARPVKGTEMARGMEPVNGHYAPK